jgi:hypothetical protein
MIAKRILHCGFFGCLIATGCSRAPSPVAVETPDVQAVPTVAVQTNDKPGEAPTPIVPVVTETPAKPAESVFAFPDDLGGKAVAKRLSPVLPETLPAAQNVTQKPRAVPAFLDNPLPATGDLGPLLPKLTLPAAKPVRPTPLPDRVPTDLTAAIPTLPERAPLPHAPLVRTPGRDVNEPAELPILAKPVTDRASLDDPTLGFTAKSVIAEKLPLRTEPAGFVRYTLPEPFEHSASGKPLPPIPDDVNRSLGDWPRLR